MHSSAQAAVHPSVSAARPPATDRDRIQALDALRGVLAALIVAHHVSTTSGWPAIAWAAWWIVAVFWGMSGYVLAAAYDGRYIAFLLRRTVRLWPVYAVCTAVAALLIGRLPTLGELAWWPSTLANGAEYLLDPPAWSLYVEMWLTPLLPPMFWVVRQGPTAAIALAAAALAATAVHPWFDPVACFAVGVALTRLPIVWPRGLPGGLLWLGQVSYSLYLSHFIVIVVCASAFGRPIGPLLSLLVIPGVAWGLWHGVERPSIIWSRAVGRWRLPA